MSELSSHRFICHLERIMDEQGITVDELHRRTGVGKDCISHLRTDQAERVTLKSLAMICSVLNITLNDLFEPIVEDIWMPIRLHGEVTIHVGSNTVNEPRPVSIDGKNEMMTRQFIGSWDFRAIDCISEYLRRICPGVTIRLREHPNRRVTKRDPAIHAEAQSIFERGNHLILGSPISNQLAEEVISSAFGVPSFDPQSHRRFPYIHCWEPWRRVSSSFGETKAKAAGIAVMPSRRIVAPYKLPPDGPCNDGAVIVTMRCFENASANESNPRGERSIICLSGHGGVGTLAAARIATDPAYAAGLYPSNANARMRAIACTYNRLASDAPFDPRDLTSITLLEDHQNSSSETVVDEGKKRTRSNA